MRQLVVAGEADARAANTSSTRMMAFCLKGNLEIKVGMRSVRNIKQTSAIFPPSRSAHNTKRLKCWWQPFEVEKPAFYVADSPCLGSMCPAYQGGVSVGS